jgi:hypothetical protein
MPPHKLRVHPAEYWTSVEAQDRLNKRKICVAAGAGNCNGQIIGAHTVPRSQLRKIAIGGHVYEIRPNDLLKNDGQFTVHKRGIGQFSVLNFFCAQHDREIFSHLENDELTFDAHQLSLLHYRAMGAELYKKINALDGNKLRIAGEEAANRVGKKQALEFLEAFQTGTMLGLRDMSRIFPKTEALVMNEEYDQVSALVVRFGKMPSIMTVGGFAPEFDYDGRRAQTLGKAETQYDAIAMSILATPSGSAVVFTWLKDAKTCENFVMSYIRQRADRFTTLSIQTAFEHLENTCMNIEWWDGLRTIERNTLIQRMQYAGSPVEERTSGCLQYCGITFDQWDYVDHVFVNCN